MNSKQNPIETADAQSICSTIGEASDAKNVEGFVVMASVSGGTRGGPSGYFFDADMTGFTYFDAGGV
jgi:hypothetical protein